MITATKRLSIRKEQRNTKVTKKGKVMLDPQDLPGSSNSPKSVFLSFMSSLLAFASTLFCFIFLLCVFFSFDIANRHLFHFYHFVIIVYFHNFHKYLNAFKVYITYVYPVGNIGWTKSIFFKFFFFQIRFLFHGQRRALQLVT